MALEIASALARFIQFKASFVATRSGAYTDWHIYLKILARHPSLYSTTRPEERPKPLPRSLANGDGIGLTVAAPGFKSPPGVRVIPLPGIPPVMVGVPWAGKLSPIAHQFLAEVEIEATVPKAQQKIDLAANEHRRVRGD